MYICIYIYIDGYRTNVSACKAVTVTNSRLKTIQRKRETRTIPRGRTPTVIPVPFPTAYVTFCRGLLLSKPPPQKLLNALQLYEKNEKNEKNLQKKGMLNFLPQAPDATMITVKKYTELIMRVNYENYVFQFKPPTTDEDHQQKKVSLFITKLLRSIFPINIVKYVEETYQQTVDFLTRTVEPPPDADESWWYERWWNYVFGMDENDHIKKRPPTQKKTTTVQQVTQQQYRNSVNKTVRKPS